MSTAWGSVVEKLREWREGKSVAEQELIDAAIEDIEDICEQHPDYEPGGFRLGSGVEFDALIGEEVIRFYYHDPEVAFVTKYTQKPEITYRLVESESWVIDRTSEAQWGRFV